MGKFEYSQWYQENKEKLRRKRAIRYRLNKPFREQMKGYSKRYYEMNLKKSTPRSVMVIDGEKYLTIGGLAKVIGRTEQTIREYHKDGILPKAERGNNRGWRVYSIPHAKVIKEAFQMFGNDELLSLQEVKHYIKERW